MSFTMPVGESVREVLPGLQSIFFGEPPPNTTFPAIWQVSNARQLSGHPITVSRWDKGRGKQEVNA